MVFTLPEEINIQQATLKVKDLENMIQFYTTTIGLVLLKQEDKMAWLGVQESEEALLVLKEYSGVLENHQTAGLYHIAFLLPTRKDLGNTLLWLLKHKVELGAADHGYSEALYLNDPEGNGIEIYRDKPVAEWDIRPNGEIVGVTEELDGDGVIAAADGQWSGLAIGSKIGHIHLQVSDLEETEVFLEALGFSLKLNFGNRAKFFAAGMYHHHIGTNTWAGRNLPKMSENQLGLADFTFHLPSKVSWEMLKKQLEGTNLSFVMANDQLVIDDPNGLQVIFTY